MNYIAAAAFGMSIGTCFALCYHINRCGRYK